MENDTVKETGQEQKKVSARVMLGRAVLLLLMSVLEDLVYAAKVMFEAVFPSLIVYLFIYQSGLLSASWFVVWLGVSSLGAILLTIRK